MRLSQDLQPIQLSVESAVPCGLILNELASNALKHAFLGKNPGNGEGWEVKVALGNGSAGLVVMRVSDNGIGLPPGLDWRQCSSLGLRLVQMLTGQLGGTVEVQTQEGQGTEFQVVFGH